MENETFLLLLVIFPLMAQQPEKWAVPLHPQTPYEMLVAEYGFDPATAFDGIPDVNDPTLYSYKWSAAYNFVSSLPVLTTELPPASLASMRLVNSDEPSTETHPSPPTPVTLVQGTIPMQPVTGSMCPSPICISFSGQGAAALKAVTGKRVKGLQLVEASMCVRSTQYPVIVPVGVVIGLGNGLGFPHIDAAIASSIIKHTVDLGWRNVTKVVTTEGLAIAASIFVPGIVAVSKASTTGVTLGYIFMNHEGALLAPGAPDPSNFTSGLKTISESISFAASGCQSILYAARYKGKGSVTETGFIPLQMQ